MHSFGLVSEGITDEAVIANILAGYFDANDVDLNPLQPLRDATDRSRTIGSPGWTEVIGYVKSSKLEAAFQFFDYIIVQIDTDVCELKGYDVPRSANGRALEPLELLERVCDKFREWIGETIYDKRKERIILAIAVDSIECWLMPLYFPSDKAKRSKTVNCIGTLNEALQKAHGFTISAKEFAYYNRASQGYKRRKALLQAVPHNPSLKAFIDELDSRKLFAEDEA